ncbi:hypothetical protein [Natrinema gelatinilyticum]|uniref:hypothetical protein n=1 Tax=Natrinema gelatinilyticum TaxID=2961571 RepID=UPI0020C43F84|nr:hypothetical protein [Natrinema gelatinilyticum]
MDDVVIDLDGRAEVDLQTVDVGVAGDTVAFGIEGVIRDVDNDVLVGLSGKSLTPTEIHFSVATD